MDVFEDFDPDFLSDADQKVIKCVLRGALGGAVLGGVAGSAIPAIGSGVGAVTLAIVMGAVSYKACSKLKAASDGGMVQRMSTRRAFPADLITEVRENFASEYGLNDSDATLLTKAAFAVAGESGKASVAKSYTQTERANAVAIILEKLKTSGVAA